MKTDIVRITGMTCDGCASKIARALKAIGGVHDVVVSRSAGEAAVRYDELLASPKQLQMAVRHAGYGVGDPGAAHTYQFKSGCCG